MSGKWLDEGRCSIVFLNLSLDFVGPLPSCSPDIWRPSPSGPRRLSTTSGFSQRKSLSCFGFCEQIHSNRVTQLTGNFVKKVAWVLGIKVTQTPAYNPKSKPVERFHREFERGIKSLVKQLPNQWEEGLPHTFLLSEKLRVNKPVLGPTRSCLAEIPPPCLTLYSARPRCSTLCSRRWSVSCRAQTATSPRPIRHARLCCL
jgi:hypothetical protein